MAIRAILGLRLSEAATHHLYLVHLVPYRTRGH